MLTKANIVGTPGVGFGANGAGKFRLTAFNTYENTVEAMKRFREVIK
jgi:LL-diaminopimelate aminotransferase